MDSTQQMKSLASAMKTLFPPPLLAEVIAHLDPATPFLEYLRDPSSASDGFHNRDGWYFARISDDGQVRIRKRATARDDAGIVAEIVIPENEWASIVASVSRGGETGASWQFVRDFHNGGCKCD